MLMEIYKLTYLKFQLTEELLVQLTFYSGNEIVSRPSYSPDGTKIAFNRLKVKQYNIFTFFDWVFVNFTGDIYIIPSNGGTANCNY